MTFSDSSNSGSPDNSSSCVPSYIGSPDPEDGVAISAVSEITPQDWTVANTRATLQLCMDRTQFMFAQGQGSVQELRVIHAALELRSSGSPTSNETEVADIARNLADSEDHLAKAEIQGEEIMKLLLHALHLIIVFEYSGRRIASLTTLP